MAGIKQQFGETIAEVKTDTDRMALIANWLKGGYKKWKGTRQEAYQALQSLLRIAQKKAAPAGSQAPQRSRPSAGPDGRGAGPTVRISGRRVKKL